jgi:hypothetical protein
VTTNRRPRSWREGTCLRHVLLRWRAPQPVCPTRYHCGQGPRPYARPCTDPYARDSRTPSSAGGRITAGYAPRGASRPQTPRLTGPPRGSGAAAPEGALRAIDSTARPHSWRTFGPRRLRRQSDADHIVTQREDRSTDASRPKHAAAVCGGRRSRSMPKFRLLGFEAGQEVRMPNWNWSSVEMGASSAARSGRPEPGLAGWRPGEVAQGSPTLG